MRIAHLSDLHVLCLEAAVFSRMVNKRITGYANIRLHRGNVHSVRVLRAVLDDLACSEADHFVVTGDLTNLALEAEFERTLELFDTYLRVPPSRITIVPGNHDVYTRGSERTMRFSRYFERYLTSDLPSLQVRHGAGLFPIVKLRGTVAFIGLATAIARPPLFATGRLGRLQLEWLAKVLQHPEVRARMPVIVLHHPPHQPSTWRKRLTTGLEDAQALLETIAELPRGLMLHGHLHRRMRGTIPTRSGELDIVGATSASLIATDPRRSAGYNLYDLDNDGNLKQIHARVYDSGEGRCKANSFADVAEILASVQLPIRKCPACGQGAKSARRYEGAG